MKRVYIDRERTKARERERETDIPNKGVRKI